MTTINFHKSDPSLNDPFKAHPTDAGWDLPAAVEFYSSHPNHQKLSEKILISFAKQAYKQMVDCLYEDSFSLECVFDYKYEDNEHTIHFRLSDSDDSNKSVLEWRDEIHFIQGYILGCIDTLTDQ